MQQRQAQKLALYIHLNSELFSFKNSISLPNNVAVSSSLSKNNSYSSFEILFGFLRSYMVKFQECYTFFSHTGMNPTRRYKFHHILFPRCNNQFPVLTFHLKDTESSENLYVAVQRHHLPYMRLGNKLFT